MHPYKLRGYISNAFLYRGETSTYTVWVDDLQVICCKSDIFDMS